MISEVIDNEWTVQNETTDEKIVECALASFTSFGGTIVPSTPLQLRDCSGLRRTSQDSSREVSTLSYEVWSGTVLSSRKTSDGSCMWDDFRRNRSIIAH